jgi:hypothetical protein
MSRTLKTTARAVHTGPARDDWRAMLAKREAKRAARQYRQARKPSLGFVHAGLIASLCAVLIVLASVGALYTQLAHRLARAACETPVNACTGADECRRQADCL